NEGTVTRRGMLFHSFITSSSTCPMIKVPPSMKTRPGPVSCSYSAWYSKPPNFASLYFHPVVEETLVFLPPPHDPSIKAVAKLTNNKLDLNLIAYLLNSYFSVTTL